MTKKLIVGSLLTALSLIFLILPNVIWFYMNRDTYFREDSTSLSIGAIMTLIYIVAVMKGAFKQIDKRFATLFSLILFTVIVQFMEAIIHDLVWILMFGSIGYLFYLVFSFWASSYLRYYKAYKDESARVYARKEIDSEVGNV